MKLPTVSQFNRWFAVMIAVVSLGTIPQASAFSITNPGFETDSTLDISVGGAFRDNVSGDGQFFNPLATGWTLLYPTTPGFDDKLAVVMDLYGPTYSPPGYLNHNPDGSISTGADDNNIVGLLRSNQVSQALSTTFLANSDYQLSIQAARLNNQSIFPGGRLILGYGTASSFTILATVTNVDNTAGFDTLPDAAPGEWTTITLLYNTGNSGPELGQNVVIAFAPTDQYAGTASYADNFVFVPEPSSVAFACAGFLLLCRRRIH